MARLDLFIFTGKHWAVHSKPSQATTACSSSSSGERWLTAGWWPRLLVLLEWHWVRQQRHCCGSSVGPHAIHWRSGGCAGKVACHSDVPDEEGTLEIYFYDFMWLWFPSGAARYLVISCTFSVLKLHTFSLKHLVEPTCRTSGLCTVCDSCWWKYKLSIRRTNINSCSI